MVYFPANFEIILSDSLDLYQVGTLHNLTGALSRTKINELLLLLQNVLTGMDTMDQLPIHFSLARI